jgi:hypothetical protein
MRSFKDSPWFWYCFATETHKSAGFALTSFSRARSASGPPFLIWRASSISSSGDSSSYLPISCKYLSSEGLSRLVYWRVILILHA